MPKVEFKGLKGVIIVLFLAVLIVILFVHINNQPATKDEEAVTVTAVQEVLSRNLTTNYPSTPKEVVKYFSEITKCFYNETFTDEELTEMADKILLLYDDELVANNTYDEYIADLRSDINFYNTNGYRISSYSPSASTDVEYFTQDGSEWARIWCIYTIKSGQNYKAIQEVFILRKDEKSHWRIFGWDLVKDE